MFRTLHAPRNSQPPTTLDERTATASLHSATPKRKNVPYFFDFRGGGFFLKWKGHFSFWGSALQVFGQCGGASIRTRQSENLFFWGKGFFRLPSADFPPEERGLGNECGRDFRFGFFGGGHCKKLKSLVLWLYS